jgi:hypothetical protein
VGKSGLILAKPHERFHFDALPDGFTFEEFFLKVSFVSGVVCPNVESFEDHMHHSASYRCPGGTGSSSCDRYFGGFSESQKREFTEMSEFWSQLSSRGSPFDWGCWGIGSIENCLGLTPKPHLPEMLIWEKGKMVCKVYINGRPYASGSEINMASSKMTEHGAVQLRISFQCPLDVSLSGSHFLGTDKEIYFATGSKATAYALSGCPMYKEIGDDKWQFNRANWAVNYLSPGRFEFGAKWSGGVYGKAAAMNDAWLDGDGRFHADYIHHLTSLQLAYTLSYPKCAPQEMIQDLDMSEECALKYVVFEGYLHSVLSGGDLPTVKMLLWGNNNSIGKIDSTCVVRYGTYTGTSVDEKPTVRGNLLALKGSSVHALDLKSGLWVFWTPKFVLDTVTVFIPVEVRDNLYLSDNEVVGEKAPTNTTGIDISSLSGFFSGLMEYLIPMFFIFIGAVLFSSLPMAGIILIAVGVVMLLPKVLGANMIQPVVGPSMRDVERLYHAVNFGGLIANVVSKSGALKLRPVVLRLISMLIRLGVVRQYWDILTPKDKFLWLLEYVAVGVGGWYSPWCDYFCLLIVIHAFMLHLGIEFIDNFLDEVIGTFIFAVEEFSWAGSIFTPEPNPSWIWIGFSWREFRRLASSLHEDFFALNAGEHAASGPVLHHWSEVADDIF